MLPPSRPRSARRAFTLLELVVVVVVLAVLAAIAIPTFARVLQRSQDASAEQTLRALDREARALAAFDARPVTLQDYELAASDLQAASVPGTSASAYSVAAVAAPGQLGVRVEDGAAGLTLLSGSGHCVLLRSDDASARVAVRRELPSSYCSGALALTVTPDGTTGLPVLTGALSWAQQFGTANYEEARAVAAAGNGTVYSTWYTTANGGDALLRSFAPDGTPGWTQTVATTSSSGAAALDFGYGLAAAPDGSAYLVGRTDGTLVSSAGDGDAFVVAYAPDGTTRWTRQFGTAGLDYASGVAVAPDGTVYVTGRTAGSLDGPTSGLHDVFVRAYGPDGSLLWARQFGTSGEDYGTAATVGPDGTLYVGGHTTGSLEGGSAGTNDAFVRSYSPAGSSGWTRQYGTGWHEYVQALAAAPDGTVYVGGYVTNGSLDAPNVGGDDAYVRSYSSSGSLHWGRQYGTSAHDYATGLAVTSTGLLHVSGYTAGSLDAPSLGSSDLYVRTYDASGSVSLARQYGTTSDDRTLGAALALDGGLYVTGFTEGVLGASAAGSTDPFLLKLQ